MFLLHDVQSNDACESVVIQNATASGDLVFQLGTPSCRSIDTYEIPIEVSFNQDLFALILLNSATEGFAEYEKIQVVGSSSVILRASRVK